MLTSTNILNAARDLPFGRKRVFNAVRQLIKFAHLFTNKTTTVDGTRYLVNEGDKSAPVSKGDFAGDYSDFSTGGAYSLIDSELSFSNTSFSFLNWKYPFENGVEYVVEIDVAHINGGGLRENGLFTILANTVGVTRTTITGDGSSLSVYQDTYDGTVDPIRVKSIKVYPASEAPAQDAVMHTGQGAYFNGVDNYIDTGFTPDTTGEITILCDMQYKNGLTNLTGSYSGGQFNLGFYTDGTFKVGVSGGSDVTFSNDGSIIDGYSYNLSFTVDGSEIVTYLNGAIVASGNYSPLNIGQSFTIGNLSGTSSYYTTGSISGFYAIPKALTAQEISNHYNNPEQTLYWDNGVLKSDILDQATIDSMQAGNGFWYPMTENVSAGGYYRNHALPMPVNLVVNGDFATGDFTGWDISESAGKWSVVNNQAVMSSTTDFTPLKYNTGFADGESYAIDIDVVAITGEMKVQGGLPSNFSASFNTTGVKRLVVTENYTNDFNDGWIQISRALGGKASSCTIDNIKVYPLANSGLTPLTNWTETTSTNASQLTSGYQCALQELDSFGLPIAKPDGLLHGDGRGYIDLQDQVIVGDFELDIFLPANNVTARERLLNSSLTTDQVTYDPGDISVSFGGYMFWINSGSYPDNLIFTARRIGVTVSFYLNGVFWRSGTGNTDSVVIGTLFSRDSVVEALFNSATANFQITKGTRTDEQRTADVNKLMTKYGVTA